MPSSFIVTVSGGHAYLPDCNISQPEAVARGKTTNMPNYKPRMSGDAVTGQTPTDRTGSPKNADTDLSGATQLEADHASVRRNAAPPVRYGSAKHGPGAGSARHHTDGRSRC